MRFPLHIWVFTLFLSACASAPVFESHDRFLKNQNASILGQSNDFLSASPCRSVLLIPDTVYFNNILRSDTRRMKKKDIIYLRLAQCSSDGTFLFENLPAEKWIAVSLHKTPKNLWTFKSRHVTSRANTKDELFFPR